MGKLGLRHLFLAKKTRLGSITRAHDKVGLVAGSARQGPDEGWVSPTVSGKEIVVKASWRRCRQRMSKRGEFV